jgi:hypothetical protein
MRVLVGLVVVAVLWSGQSFAAELEGPKPGAESSDMAAREELVRRYFKAMDFETLMDSMVSSMIPGLTEQTNRRTQGLTPEQKQLLAEVVGDTMREVMTPMIIEAHVTIYSEAFTERELRALVAYYESPEGRSVMQKMPSLMPKAAAVSRNLMPQMEREVMTRLCARIDCSAVRAPKGQTS